MLMLCGDGATNVKGKAMFESQITVEQGTGAYVGRWVVCDKGVRMYGCDYATQEQAEKAAKAIRKNRRELDAANRASDRFDFGAGAEYAKQVRANRAIA